LYDELLRPLKDRLIFPLARLLSPLGPTGLTIGGLGLGLVGVYGAFQGFYGLALGFWLGNRLADGLDGAVARLTGKNSDLGGYLDILADFLVYSLLPLGVFWSLQGDSSSWLALGALLASFYLNAASWMYLSALLAKDEALTSLPMPKGLVEGFESIIFLSLMLIFPSVATILAWTMTGLVMLTIVLRFIWARTILDSPKKAK